MEVTLEEVLEVVAVIAALLLSGLVLAFVFGATGKRWRERRHRRLSAARRAENSDYNLFEKREAIPKTRRRRKRKSAPNLTVDILKRGEDGTAVSKADKEEGESRAP